MWPKPTTAYRTLAFVLESALISLILPETEKHEMCRDLYVLWISPPLI
jgi:hypothetical protein